VGKGDNAENMEVRKNDYLEKKRKKTGNTAIGLEGYGREEKDRERSVHHITTIVQIKCKAWKRS